MKNFIKTFIKNEEGQGLTEYAISGSFGCRSYRCSYALGGTMKSKFEYIDEERKDDNNRHCYFAPF